MMCLFLGLGSQREGNRDEQGFALKMWLSYLFPPCLTLFFEP